MKLIFLVCNYQHTPEYVDYVMLSAEDYAKRVNADIYVHKEFNEYVKAFNPDHQGFFEKFELFKRAEKYDQALMLNSQ